MEAVDYQIAPVRMGGTVKQVVDNFIKINLYGRLGVLNVPKNFIIGNNVVNQGNELTFYFSYVQMVEYSSDYDYSMLQSQDSLIPCLVGGVLVEVNDTAVKIKIENDLGTIAVPRRWVFTPFVLQVGQFAEFYLSCMKLTETL
jgi:hypothetical protein